MVWGRRDMEELLELDFSFPTGKLKFMTNSKYNSFCGHAKQDTMNCNCGEEEKDFAWVWSKKEEGGQAGSIVLDPECRQISFNPEYSSGTAAVRGNQILPSGYHHYWELKMTSAVYGTNIMIGICTPKCDMRHGIHRFCSLLGRDEESWGYSYTGTTQHAGKFSRYGPRWGKGAIVGVHLDTWRGTLEFFLNREPLGIAFTGLQSRELYPIVTSTSAHSGMKLVTSYMFPHSLQFLSSEVLFKRFPRKRDLHPGDLSLPPGLQTYIQNNYWPFIKYVSLRSGSSRIENLRLSDNGFECIRLRKSKRAYEEDSRDTVQYKRACTHPLFSLRQPYTSLPEVSNSSTKSSSSNESSPAVDHQCLCLSSCSKFPHSRSGCHSCECFPVTFDSRVNPQESTGSRAGMSSIPSGGGDDQINRVLVSTSEGSQNSQNCCVVKDIAVTQAILYRSGCQENAHTGVQFLTADDNKKPRLQGSVPLLENIDK